jgi:hypothetical protein
MERIKWEVLKEENQTDICTEKCASLHSLQCMRIKDVKQKIENPLGKSCFLDVE